MLNFSETIAKKTIPVKKGQGFDPNAGYAVSQLQPENLPQL